MSNIPCEERSFPFYVEKQNMEVKPTKLQRDRFPSMLFQRQFPNLVPYCLLKLLAFVSQFSLQCLQSVLVQESLHTLLRCRRNGGFWHPATGYHLLGTFSACHLSPLCFCMFITVETLTSKYFVEVTGCFFSGYKLLFIQIVGTAAIWQLLPAEGLCFSTRHHISTQFSLLI